MSISLNTFNMHQPAGLLPRLDTGYQYEKMSFTWYFLWILPGLNLKNFRAINPPRPLAHQNTSYSATYMYICRTLPGLLVYISTEPLTDWLHVIFHMWPQTQPGSVRTTFIKQNGANNFNMAIKSSGRDREQTYARLWRLEAYENGCRSVSFLLYCGYRE